MIFIMDSDWTITIFCSIGLMNDDLISAPNISDSTRVDIQAETRPGRLHLWHYVSSKKKKRRGGRQSPIIERTTAALSTSEFSKVQWSSLRWRYWEDPTLAHPDVLPYLKTGTTGNTTRAAAQSWHDCLARQCVSIVLCIQDKSSFMKDRTRVTCISVLAELRVPKVKKVGVTTYDHRVRIIICRGRTSALLWGSGLRDFGHCRLWSPSSSSRSLELLIEISKTRYVSMMMMRPHTCLWSIRNFHSIEWWSKSVCFGDTYRRSWSSARTMPYRGTRSSDSCACDSHRYAVV